MHFVTAREALRSPERAEADRWGKVIEAAGVKSARGGFARGMRHLPFRPAGGSS